MQKKECDSCKKTIFEGCSYLNEHKENDLKDYGIYHYDFWVIGKGLKAHYNAYEKDKHFPDQWPGHLKCFVEKETFVDKEVFSEYNILCEECFDKIKD